MPWSMSIVNIDQSIHLEKIKVAQNEKRKKLHGFSYYKNIGKFEAFWRDKNFRKNLLFLGSYYNWVLTCVGETSDLSMPPEPVALENKAKATLMAILIRLLVLSGSSSYNQGIREWFS